MQFLREMLAQTSLYLFIMQFVKISTYVNIIIVTSPGFPRILESHSWNLRKEFSRPGKSWKMLWSWKSHGIPPVGHGIF